MLNKEQETLFEIIESDKNILLFSELGVKVVIEVLLLFELTNLNKIPSNFVPSS
jgi:hypothetical protein